MVIDLLKLILTIPFVLILPGAFFLLAIFGWKSASGGRLSFFEKAALSVPLSLIVVNLLVLLLDKLNIVLRGPFLAGGIAFFCLACFVIFQIRFGMNKKKETFEVDESEKIFDFSSWQTIFILLALFLAVFIRSAYLSDTVLPSSTDLGHHMYWVQKTIDSGNLPDYGMPDFIIGEHIIFAVVNLISGVRVMTAMPTLLLLLFNIAGIFTIAILLGRVFASRKVAAISFFVAGSLFAVNAPQGKYVSGGVVGNIIGDMLIPVALYFLVRALTEKNQIFAGLFLFSFAGLLYTHHLSSLILIFSVAAILAMFLMINLQEAFKIARDWLKIFLKPFPVVMLVIMLVYFLVIFTPSYFNPGAVGTATGQPSKITRAGLSLTRIEGTVGSAQFIFGSLGFLIAFFAFRTKEFKYSFALGWFLILFMLTWKPGWLYVNIPSDRISNYLYLPLATLSSYALVKFFEMFKSATSRFFSTIVLFTLMFFIITNGLADSADAFKTKNQFQEIMETFHSAEYLAGAVDTDNDVVLKDHVNLYGDSWYKLFFMKDYKYPLSRGVLTRYVDPTKPRETCTRDMIAEPESEIGKACFSETGVNFIALNAQMEGDSFEEYGTFSKIYGSDYISVFRRD